MSYNALVVQIMVSSPSDLPREHVTVIHSAMRKWNIEHGKLYGIHFSPTDWVEGASPAFGAYAQQVLNDQIVDESDMAIVIFTDRMGTPTPSYPSGTAEEIARFTDAGKDVGVFRNNTPRTPPSGSTATGQKAALEAYIETLYTKAFVDAYQDEGELKEKTSSLLTRLASKMRREADAGLVVESAAPQPKAITDDPSKGVWPRVEVEATGETDLRGRLRTRRRWYLVLESNLDAPVHEVGFRYEDGDGNEIDDFDIGPQLGHGHVSIDILPPRGSQRFSITQSMGSPGSAMCVVHWKSVDGEEHETRASVHTNG